MEKTDLSGRLETTQEWQAKASDDLTLVSIPLILRINWSYLREKKESFFLAVHVFVPSGALEQSDG